MFWRDSALCIPLRQRNNERSSVYYCILWIRFFYTRTVNLRRLCTLHKAFGSTSPRNVTLVINGGEWSISGHGQFTSKQRTPSTHQKGISMGPDNWSGHLVEEKTTPHPGNWNIISHLSSPQPSDSTGWCMWLSSIPNSVSFFYFILFFQYLSYYSC